MQNIALSIHLRHNWTRQLDDGLNFTGEPALRDDGR